MNPDPRHLDNGWLIGRFGYADQPSLVATDDGAWMCVMTVGSGREGAAGQHVVVLRSTDRGRTWSEPVDIEPASGPEASWATAVKAPSGRIFVFYLHNTDNLREVVADRDWSPDGKTQRVDTLGYFVFRYSDDHGRSWSASRIEVPIRETRIDRQNPYSGRIRFGWNVSNPVVFEGSLIVPFPKVGAFGQGFMRSSEGWFLRSDDLLTCDNPPKATWQTLPDGDDGLASPHGPIADEHCLVVLSDGSLYCTYRTIEGFACHAYSRDGGHSWTDPAYMTERPGGRRIKHPRAANFVWSVGPGRYLHWSHNHGGVPLNPGSAGYRDRNPAWVRFGVEAVTEAGTMLHWSQPEVLLYTDHPTTDRISYPDLLIEEDAWYISETQKSYARIHRVPHRIHEAALQYFEPGTELDEGFPRTNGELLRWDALDNGPLPTAFSPPSLPSSNQDQDSVLRCERAGFTIDLTLHSPNVNPGTLLDLCDVAGHGLQLNLTEDNTVRLWMNDGRHECGWSSSPVSLATESPLSIAVVVDGGPNIIAFVINGQFDDGGPHRQFGWGRLPPDFRGVTGDQLKVGVGYRRRLAYLAIHGQAQLFNELAARHRLTTQPDDLVKGTVARSS